MPHALMYELVSTSTFPLVTYLHTNEECQSMSDTDDMRISDLEV
jgi:hypothetical protein